MKVLYLINDVSHYRKEFLEQLGDKVDLTVISSTEKDIVLSQSYRYIQVTEKRFFMLHISSDEFFLVKKLKPDVILLGYNLHNVFRMMNLFRDGSRVIPVGLFYSENENIFKKRVRKLILRKSKVILTYSDLVTNKLKKELKDTNIISFNNTHIRKDEVNHLDEFNFVEGKLKILWVGTYKKRKKIEVLVNLAKQFEFLEIRIVGPGIVENIQSYPTNVELYGKCLGSALDDHFLWSDLVLNPGSVGLLVMLAAKFNRPIIIDKDNYHGPEIQLAIDADQFILDIDKKNELSITLNALNSNKELIRERGMVLKRTLMEKYLIENMVDNYMLAINKLL